MHRVQTLEDPIILRSKPIIRKSRFEVVGVIFDLGPATMTKVKTVKGKSLYLIEGRQRKYATVKDVRVMINAMLSELAKVKRTMGTAAYELQRYQERLERGRTRWKNDTEFRKGQNAKNLARYHKNSENINRKRREAYAAKKALR